MTEYLLVFQQWLQQYPSLQQGLKTLAMLLLVWLVHRVVRVLIDSAVTDAMHRQGYRSLARYLFILVGLVLIAGVWLEELKTVGLVLTGVLAGLLIGLKEVFLGLAGRVIVAIVNPYRIGDRICINGVCGDVINLGLLYTWVFESGGEDGSKQATGRVLTFPHIWLFQYPVTNFNLARGYLWDELDFFLPVNAPAARAMEVIEREAAALVDGEIEKAARATARMKRHFAVRLPPLEPKVYATLITDQDGGPKNSVHLSLRYIVPERAIRERRNALTLRILPELRRLGVFPPGRIMEPGQEESSREEQGESGA